MRSFRKSLWFYDSFLCRFR